MMPYISGQIKFEDGDLGYKVKVTVTKNSKIRKKLSVLFFLFHSANGNQVLSVFMRTYEWRQMFPLSISRLSLNFAIVGIFNLNFRFFSCLYQLKDCYFSCSTAPMTIKNSAGLYGPTSGDQWPISHLSGFTGSATIRQVKPTVVSSHLKRSSVR